MEAKVAERRRKHFRNKRATSLRKMLLNAVLRTKAEANKEWGGNNNGSYASDNYDLTPTLGAYLMRPPSCNNIQLKHVICFANSQNLRYATAQVETTTYLLAMSPMAIELGCRAWYDSTDYWKRTKKNVDHLRGSFTTGGFRALKILLDLVHGRKPNPHDVALTSARSLAMMSAKLVMTQKLSNWAHEFLTQLMIQVRNGDPAGISSLELLGWPCFIRQCKLGTWHSEDHKRVLSWGGKKISLETELHTEDLIAHMSLKLLERRQGIINEILLLLTEAKFRITFCNSIEESEAVTRKLISFRVAFCDSRIPTDLTRDGWTDAYTDGSVDEMISWIRGTGDDNDPNAAECIRGILEQLAVDVDYMVTARLDEMKFSLE
ncbi:hypothetical protein PG999_002138 [Apiospora kogelbergensis]|uniref:Uncharacterized protein n=1 Tax=Apiospora kogelbergensis TaxID=1337665 RepID=A0AAW0R7H4_9PEZI